MKEPHYLESDIRDDLAEKMVFIGDPRQVGKTTLALSLLGPGHDESSPAYLNWDLLADRDKILTEQLPSEQPRIVLDEVHKYVRWRNLVKGWLTAASIPCKRRSLAADFRAALPLLPDCAFRRESD